MERRGPFVVNWTSCARRAGLALLCAARELDDRLREHVALDRTAKLVEVVPLGKPQLAVERVEDERVDMRLIGRLGATIAIEHRGI